MPRNSVLNRIRLICVLTHFRDFRDRAAICQEQCFSNSDGTITENSTIEFTISQNLQLTGTVVRNFNRGTSAASTTTETYSGSKASE